MKDAINFQEFMQCLTLAETRDRRAAKCGRWSLAAVYDPQNRGGEFVQDLLEGHGLHVEIEDEQETTTPGNEGPA